MPRPVTRSMTRLMAEKTEHSNLSPAASEENIQVCREHESLPGPSYLFKFCQTFSFLLLPGEIRNTIYRDLLGPRFNRDGIISISLFRTQPAITRVNKQIRAESLSIYYAENRFRMQVYIENTPSYYGLRNIDFVEFCDSIKRFAPAQAQRASIQNSLRHIRDFEAKLFIETYTDAIRVARFEKKPDGHFRSETCFWDRPWGRLGGDDTDWADRTSVDALVKQWMEERHGICTPPPDLQDRLMHVLWLLGVNITSDLTTRVCLI